MTAKNHVLQNFLRVDTLDNLLHLDKLQEIAQFLELRRHQKSISVVQTFIWIVFLFCSDHLKNAEELCIGVLKFFVFHAKSGNTNNPRNG